MNLKFSLCKGGKLICVLAFALTASSPLAADELFFNRVASFSVAKNLPADIDPSTETSAEIVAVSGSGMLLAYSDSPLQAVGFVDISDASNPKPAGLYKLDGKPTAVAMLDETVFVSINTSANFTSPSGQLQLIEAGSSTPLAVCELGGQPDSIAINPRGNLVAVAIENERDEDLNDGSLPQLPAGMLVVFDIEEGLPVCSSHRNIDLDGLADIGAADPEPEFVDFNNNNEIVVTLQENNHIVIVNAVTGMVVSEFSAGAVDLENVDTSEEGALTFDGAQQQRKREPDGVQWLSDETLVVANEGDYEGGSRGFTIFNRAADVLYESGLDFEYALARAGHYPEKRSANKGIEPEGLEVSMFDGEQLIFVLAERGSAVGVYRNNTANMPELLQLLPSGIGPEGAVAIPLRNIFVTSNEVDLFEDNGPRSHIMIYERGSNTAAYPQIVSNMKGDRPIGWGALSALAADPQNETILYAVNDSYYTLQPAVYTIDISAKPAQIVKKTVVTRGGFPAQKLDLEGIAVDGQGGFWLASEGRSGRQIPHALYHVDASGEINIEVSLPPALQAVQKRFGFEGLATTGTGKSLTLWIAVQREWQDDAKGFVKILSYVPASKEWGAVRYPLDRADKGWVGLSAIESFGDSLFIVERDNQVAENAKIKRLYKIDVPEAVRIDGKATLDNLPVVEKQFVRDFLPDLKSTNGFVLDKLEGFAITRSGIGYAVTDNDGVDDHSGETYFFSTGSISN